MLFDNNIINYCSLLKRKMWHVPEIPESIEEFESFSSDLCRMGKSPVNTKQIARVSILFVIMSLGWGIAAKF